MRKRERERARAVGKRGRRSELGQSGDFLSHVFRIFYSVGISGIRVSVIFILISGGGLRVREYW